MRKLSLFAFATVAALTFAGTSNATPLGAAGTLAATTNTAVANEMAGTTEVQYRRRHYRGYRSGYRHSWRHRHHNRYGYYHRPHRGVRVIIR